MLEMMPIASGSSGNCIYMGTDGTHILVDAGISGKRAQEGLNSMGLSMDDVDAVLVTHEHSDHVKGLGVLARKYGKPMYATKGTIDAIMKDGSLGRIPDGLFHVIEEKRDFSIKDMEFRAVPISHDAAQPVGYIARSGGRSAAVITDLGCYDDKLLGEIKGLDILLLEANHDVRMLETGRYPYPLKMRILSERGHLSNESSGKLLTRVLHDGTKAVFLGHLSRENNMPPLALECVKAEITLSNTPYKGSDFPIYVARRDTPSERITA